ncbi:MAG: hypothetical protein V4641_31385 [Pseudomonadota bacterium]
MMPFELIALKQKVGHEYADEAALFVLIHFDAAKRGALGPVGYNFISRHLVQAQFIFAKLRQPALLDVVRVAGEAWQRAGARPGEFASLTTAEYGAMCAGLRVYLRTLHKIEAGTYRQACNVADQVMK